MEYIKNNINYILIFIIAFLGTFFQGSFFAYGYIGIIVISVLGLLINNKFKMNVTFWLFAVMPVITLLTALYAVGLKWQAMREVIRYCLYPAAYIWLFNTKVKSERCLKIFIYSLAVITIIGLFAFNGAIKISGAVIEKSNRMSSLFQNANINAVMMLFGIIVSLDFIVKEKRIIFIFFLLLFSYSFYVSRSRYTFMLLIFILYTYTVFGKVNLKIKMIILSILTMFIISIFISGGRITNISLLEGTLTERLTTYKDALNYLIKKPIQGMGAGEWQDVMYEIRTLDYETRYLHCFILQLWCDGGIVCALSFISVFIGAVLMCLKSIHKNYINLFTLLIFILHSMFDVDFEYGIISFLTVYIISEINKKYYERRK